MIKLYFIIIFSWGILDGMESSHLITPSPTIAELICTSMKNFKSSQDFWRYTCSGDYQFRAFFRSLYSSSLIWLTPHQLATIHLVYIRQLLFKRKTSTDMVSKHHLIEEASQAIEEIFKSLTHH